MKRLTRADWIERFRTKHGDKFDYTDIPTPTNNTAELTIRCPKHGPFSTTFMRHSLYDCERCGIELTSQKNTGGRCTAEEALSHYTVDANGCWIWRRYINTDGYGEAAYAGKNWLAHRLSHQTYNAPLTKGKMICHRCDVPACINPKHLYEGTAVDNNRDREARGRGGAAKGQLTQAHNNGLTKEAIQAIFDAPDHATNASLAEQYGTNRQTVSEIRRGLRYYHLLDKAKLANRLMHMSSER